MIECKELSLYYKDGKTERKIFENVNINIGPGKKVVFLGPSGSGKSSLIYLLSGLRKPTSGSILYNSVDYESLNERQMTLLRSDDFGFIFQMHFLIPYLTVFENIEIGLKKKGPNYKTEIEELSTRLGLEEHLHKKIYQMSGGQRQRVAIARALIKKPKIIFADEPTASLDHQTSLEVMRLLDEQMSGASLIMATHDTSVIDESFNVIHIKDNLFENFSESDSSNISENTQVLSTKNNSSLKSEVPSKSPVFDEANPKNSWIQNGNRWSFFDATGKIVKDRWVQDKLGKRYIGVDGYLVVNQWINDGKGWVYVGTEGYITTNQWIEDSVSWIYVGQDGYLVTNQWIQDTTGWFYVGADGYLVANQWVQHPTYGSVYLGTDGRMANK